MIFDLMRKWGVIGLAVALLLSSSLTSTAQAADVHMWSGKEVEILRSLWLYSLPPVPKKPLKCLRRRSSGCRAGKKILLRYQVQRQQQSFLRHLPQERLCLYRQSPRGPGHGMGFIGTGWTLCRAVRGWSHMPCSCSGTAARTASGPRR